MMTENTEPPTPADWCAYRAALRTREANLRFLLREKSSLDAAQRADARTDLAAVRDAMREEA